MRAPVKKAPRPAAPALAARLGGQVALETRADGTIAACFHGHAVGLGTFSAAAAERAQDLRVGLPLAAFASGSGKVEQEIDTLARRLARRGLLEYCLRHPESGEDQVVIEPQVADYWPGTAKPAATDTLALSRFAYLRRRGSDMVLESPLAGALFKICDPKVAAAILALSSPQPIKELRRHDGFPGGELLALLLDCRILFTVDAARGAGQRLAEGDGDLVLWDFHDLLFHARSMDGRHANPSGGLYQYADAAPPPPAVRPTWPGAAIDLEQAAAGDARAAAPAATLLRQRHSTRSFDDARPITLAELARFLDGAARVLSVWSDKDLGDDGPEVAHTVRPYPSGGASYELELYLSVNKCAGLARGFYHYDAGAHRLVSIDVRPPELEAMFAGASFAMGVTEAPQILITIAARFGRVAWKYSSIAYALVLKDAGVLVQTLYLMATDLGLGGCAIGTANIELFARMTGLEMHIEGPVGQFALGSGMSPTD